MTVWLPIAALMDPPNDYVLNFPWPHTTVFVLMVPLSLSVLQIMISRAKKHPLSAIISLHTVQDIGFRLATGNGARRFCSPFAKGQIASSLRLSVFQGTILLSALFLPRNILLSDFISPLCLDPAGFFDPRTISAQPQITKACCQLALFVYLLNFGHA